MRRLRRPILVALLLFAGPWLLALLLPNSAYYRNRRPTRLGRFTNRYMALLGSLGIGPSSLVMLETVGRKSGQPCLTALVIGECQGERYLVSMLGEQSAWVRNLRAAEGRAAIKHRGRREIATEEVPAAERAPILRSYLKRAIGARPHFPVSHDAPVEAFEPIAADYPVFRIVE